MAQTWCVSTKAQGQVTSKEMNLLLDDINSCQQTLVPNHALKNSYRWLNQPNFLLFLLLEVILYLPSPRNTTLCLILHRTFLILRYWHFLFARCPFWLSFQVQSSKISFSMTCCLISMILASTETSVVPYSSKICHSLWRSLCLEW